jgi:hypothetical protein
MLVESVTYELHALLGFTRLSVLKRDKGLLLIEVIEVFAVLLALQVGYPRHSLCTQIVPVYALKEWMV